MVNCNFIGNRFGACPHIKQHIHTQKREEKTAQVLSVALTKYTVHPVFPELSDHVFRFQGVYL